MQDQPAPRMQSRPDKLSFLPRLESLRGLAAVSVVAYHAYGLRNDTAVTGLAPVVLFFVLNGFVLARSLHNNPSALAYFRNRLFRLLPAAATTVLLLTALFYRYGFYIGFPGAAYDWSDVILNALMIRSDINGVMWSMTVERFATPLILGCFLACKKFGRAPLIGLSVVLFGLSFCGPYAHLLGGITNLAPLYAFVIGVLLHFAVVNGFRPRYVAIGALMAVVVLVVCGTRKQTSWMNLAESLAGGALILLVATNTTSRLFSALDLLPVRFVGQISYSFYLLHVIGLSLALRFGPSSTLPLFGLAVLCTLPMAWISWRFVEMPFMKLARSPFFYMKSTIASSPEPFPHQG
jgi:exopolysaccharide production protein ExoZ